MAAPFVSGAAALARQQSEDATVAEIAARLTAALQDLDDRNPAYTGQLGGLLDIGAALGDDGGEEQPLPALFLPMLQY